MGLLLVPSEDRPHYSERPDIISLSTFPATTHFLRLVSRIVVIESEVLLDALVIVRPPLVRRHDVAVPAVSCCPIEDVVEFNVLRVVRAFQEVQNPHLKHKREDLGTQAVKCEEDASLHVCEVTSTGKYLSTSVLQRSG